MDARRYVFLDRDGTIIVNKHYQKDPAITELEPGAREGLEMLRNAGFGLVLVTNQSGIGRGKLTASDMRAVNGRMVELLGGGEDFFAGMYHCPHVPDDGCSCRKPGTGLLERASKELGVCLSGSYMVGDSEADMKCGAAAGVSTILVRSGYGAGIEEKPGVGPDYVANDLMDAAKWIIEREKTGE